MNWFLGRFQIFLIFSAGTRDLNSVAVLLNSDASGGYFRVIFGVSAALVRVLLFKDAPARHAGITGRHRAWTQRTSRSSDRPLGIYAT